ncbi:MAG: hypothetical protein H8E72_08765 [Candidatus Marinimicrobia bacterium]|nr:hypothetical protein [Candidatus Neomarinimicrobiota bacterium]
MCPQTVGLVQKACEEVGIATVSISIIDEINEKINSPRYYSVPYELGYPLGGIENFANQVDICRNSLSLIY